MATILYKLVDDKPIAEKCNAVDVCKLLKSGYAVDPEQLLNRKKADTNNTGLISDAEVKELAKAEGIKIGRKSIATLKKELNL